MLVLHASLMPKPPALLIVLTVLRLMQVHGKKAVVNFRLSSLEIQWQPRTKRGASNSSAETSSPSFRALFTPVSCPVRSGAELPPSHAAKAPFSVQLE